MIYPSGCSGKNFMYLNLTSEMVLLTWSFMVVKSDVGVMTYPG